MGMSERQRGFAAGSEMRGSVASAIVNVLADHRYGGLEGLVDNFIGTGMGEVINSWISTQKNIPVSPRQVRQALGRDMIAQIARQAGVSRQQASLQIADILPQLVDRLTPSGRIPPGGIMPTGMDLMKE